MSAPAFDFENVERAHGIADQCTAHMAKLSADAGRPPTCSVGCFACCCEPVLATEAEARYIVASLSPGRRRAVTKKTRQWADTIRRTNLLDQPWPHVFDYRAANLWCPLLEKGLCSVYRRRPTGCRLHLAVGDPTDCADNRKRLHQTYASSDEIGKICMAALGVGVSKNLGVWLAEILCGIKLRTVGLFTATEQGEDLVVSYETETKI